MLDLAILENVRHRNGKTHAACPACREEGRDKAGDNLAIFDKGGYHCAAVDTDEHRRRIWQIAGVRDKGRGGVDAHRLQPRRPLPAQPRPPPPPSPPPTLPTLRPLTEDEMRRICETRAWELRAGLQLLSDRGLIWHGRVNDRAKADDSHGRDCWIVTDRTRRVAQARRLDGLKWWGRAKGITLGSASIPIGLEESRPFPHIMLCEGGPDFAAALLGAWWHDNANTIAPVALLGAGLNLPAEAAPYFAGKTVTICQHADTTHTAGQDAGARWTAQLRAAGAAAIHLAAFAQVAMADGTPCKDLADLATTFHMPEPPDDYAPPTPTETPTEISP